MTPDESSDRRRRTVIALLTVGVPMMAIVAAGLYPLLRQQYRKYYDEVKQEERVHLECERIRDVHQHEHPPQYDEKEKETLRQCEAYEGRSTPATK